MGRRRRRRQAALGIVHVPMLCLGGTDGEDASRHASTALRCRKRGQRYHHRMSTLRLQRFVRTSMWLLPIGCLAAGALLAVGTLAVDRATGYRLVPQSLTGTPSDAQTILSSFATALVSLTTLVLTVTLVAVQLAMGQFSPRIVGRCSMTAGASWRSGCSVRASW